MVLPDADTAILSSVQTTSPRTSSSATRQAPAPTYLSARSADVILSEVRPTRIKSEALRSVNVLLDELLWLILGCARSFATERLRQGLLKVLPTVLGKDALLEAEVELRAYIERNPPSSPLPTDEPAIQKFPLQQAFELLRIKCEAYSSLGDQEENVEAEATLHSRMMAIAGDATPKLSAVAPAALYLTAILEHVCEHVLSNVGRVVARDSSRSTAHIQDLYVALCEDESIYSLFKTMKVQEQIEQQSKILRPRRSKSLSRNDVPSVETPVPGTTSDTPSVPNPRQSVESALSNGSNSHNPNRGSMDKGRAKVTFKNSPRTAADIGHPGSSDMKHRRTNSLLSEKKGQVADGSSKGNTNTDLSPTEDDGSMQDFDDLMRSGTTMKVSLTPDRLKSFEVFSKEKHQRANRSGLPTTRDPSSPPSSFPPSARQPSRSRNQAEAIPEAAEDVARPRAASITQSPTSKPDKMTTARSRSFTDARVPSAQSDISPSLNKKSDIPAMTSTPSHTNPDSSGLPKRTRRPPVRRRESLDLDDVMDGSDDETPVVKKVSLTPKSAQATPSDTRDLVDFLSAGPPEPEPRSIVATSSSGGLPDPRGVKPGRFRTIVSRLTGGTSTEKLTIRSGDDSSVLTNASYRPAPVNVNGTFSPPRPQHSPLQSKRSAPNVAAAARPIPPPLSPSESTVSTPSGRARQHSTTRKAVPAWDGLKDNLKDNIDVTQPNVKQADLTGNTKPLPRPAASPTVPSPDTNPEMGSPNRKRILRDVDSSTNGTANTDMKPSSPVASHSSASPPHGHAKIDQENAKTASNTRTSKPKSPPSVGLKSAITTEQVRDFRRLMAKATCADECRVLADLFLAKCGVFPTEEKPPADSIKPPTPVHVEVDNRHEADLVEVLLGDGETLSMSGYPVTPDATTAPIDPGSSQSSQDMQDMDEQGPQSQAPVVPSPTAVVTAAA